MNIYCTTVELGFQQTNSTFNSIMIKVLLKYYCFTKHIQRETRRSHNFKIKNNFKIKYELKEWDTTMEVVTDFIFLSSKITAEGDCSHEIKRCLLFGRNAMTNLDSVLKIRDITLPTKVRRIKAMVYTIVMYRC